MLKVTLDMFSERENPTMVAEGQQAQRLLDEIASDQTIAAFSAITCCSSGSSVQLAITSLTQH